MLLPDPDLILTALGGGLAGAGGMSGWRRVRSQNKRDDAESAKVLAQAYALFTDDLRKELDAQRKENGLLRERVASLEAHVSMLLKQRDALGPTASA